MLLSLLRLPGRQYAMLQQLAHSVQITQQQHIRVAAQKEDQLPLQMHMRAV